MSLPSSEYWMIYRESGFLHAVIWYSSTPTPLPPSSVCKLSSYVSRRSSLLTGEGGVGEELNHTTARKPGPLSYSILSVTYLPVSWFLWPTALSEKLRLFDKLANTWDKLYISCRHRRHLIFGQRQLPRQSVAFLLLSPLFLLSCNFLSRY